jgi:nucleotide-binding universal stress UspA family protein
MSSLQTILAGTDFSEDAHEAVRRAASLAVGHGARLQLVHVMKGDALDELRARLQLAVDVRANLLEEARGQLDALAEEVSAITGKRPETLLKAGNVLDEVVAAADHAELLVLGAQGLSRARDVLLGTLAERLLLRSRRPMLVVKGKPDVPYRKVLVPVDFSPHSMAAVRWARRVAPSAHLKIFHAYESPYEGKLLHAGVGKAHIDRFRLEARDEAMTNLASLVGKVLPGDAEVSTSMDHGQARTLIPAEAERQQADLIVIGKQGRSALGELFLGGVTRATVSRAKCDVIVVPDHPRL